MNRDAASETQYEDSKSHLSTYNKIMLKRKLLSVFLALVLVVSLAVPALSASGSGTYNGRSYYYEATEMTTSVTNEYYSYDCVVQNGTLTGKVGSVTAAYATF